MIVVRTDFMLFSRYTHSLSRSFVCKTIRNIWNIHEYHTLVLFEIWIHIFVVIQNMNMHSCATRITSAHLSATGTCQINVFQRGCTRCCPRVISALRTRICCPRSMAGIAFGVLVFILLLLSVCSYNFSPMRAPITCFFTCVCPNDL